MKPLDPSWTDMSEYVVHFTKPAGTGTDYDSMMGIYSTATILARNTFGIGRPLAPDPDSQKAACFSEIPLDKLARLVARRGRYAIGFRKRLLVDRGGGPVLYAYKDTPHWAAVHDLMRRALASPDPAADPIWRLTPFVEAPGEHKGRPYYFEWEREWRHAGHFRFQPGEVAFLILPEEMHEAARGFFESAREENLGPAYFCPYIDSAWDLERIREHLPAA